MVSRVRPIPSEPPVTGPPGVPWEVRFARDQIYREFKRSPEHFNIPGPPATRVRQMIIEETGRVPKPAAVQRLQEAYALQDLNAAQRVVAIARKQGVTRIDADFIAANLDEWGPPPVAAPVVTPAYTRYQLAQVMPSDPIPVAKAVGVAPSAKTEAMLRCSLKGLRDVLSSLPATRRLRPQDIDFAIQNLGC